MISRRHIGVLEKIIARLNDRSINWAVTGSLGLALHGMSVEVHDIDIQTDKYGAYEAERRMAESVVQPVCHSTSERIRSHLGFLEIDGVKVEIMGDVQKRLENGVWEEPVEFERNRQWVEAHNLRVPVLSLDYEYQAYLRLGRKQKAEAIRAWLENK